MANLDGIDPTLAEVKKTLMLDSPPLSAPDCKLCTHIEAVNDAVADRGGVGQQPP